MVIFNEGMVLFSESVYYLVLSGLLIYIGKIRDHSFYAGVAIAMPVMVVLSAADLLAFTIAYLGLFAWLRMHHWRGNPNRRNWEIFVLLLVFLIDITVASVWSSIELAIFHPTLNTLLTMHRTGEWMFELFGYVLDILAAVGIRRVLSSISLTERELGIVIPQMLYVVVTMLFVTEFLQIVKVQGIYEVLVFAFLIMQVGYSTQRTISVLRKDKQSAEITLMKQQLSTMNVYTKQLEQSYEQMRKFRHDLKNLLLGIEWGDAITNSQSEYLAGLRRYSDQALAQNVLRFSDLTRVQVPTLKTLIVTKLTLAQQQGIHIHFECFNPITQLASDEITVIRIVGILLDNAIEASAGSIDKQMKVLLIDSSRDQEMIIENSYAGQLPSVSQMRKQGFSTKGENRGFGLANVESLLDQHAELALTNYVAAELYGASLVLTKEVTA